MDKKNNEKYLSKWMTKSKKLKKEKLESNWF
jgi:hypothetical protein